MNAPDPIELDVLVLAAVQENVHHAIEMGDDDKLLRLTASLISRQWACVDTRSAADQMAGCAYGAALDIRISIAFLQESLRAMLVARRIERVARNHRRRRKLQRELRIIACDLRNAWGVCFGYAKVSPYGKSR